jgi:hypothetical protein
MILFDLIFGFLLVFAGRNLFWLSVGIVGFLVGAHCAAAFGFSDSWVALVTALALGGLGAFLAVSFEWLAVVFGVGFLGGGYLLLNIFPSIAGQDAHTWLIFVAGGIVGMCLMIIIFDWTLIIISSLLGAALIVNAFKGTEILRELLFIGSLLTGMVVQYLTLRDTPSKHGRSPKAS